MAVGENQVSLQNGSQAGQNRRRRSLYSLGDYKEFFRQASLPLEVKRVNVSRGLKYYLNAVVNGLTHARYAFIGIKRSRT